MVGVSLSRWTMTYFAVALVALLTAEILMSVGWGYPNAVLAAPSTLVLVHLVTLGWLSLLLCGALFQFVPVLVAKPLRHPQLPLITLLLLVAGILTLLLGFLGLRGTLSARWALFPIASTLLAVGFGLVLWNLGRTLASARPLTLPARFVVVGLLSLVATVALGITFALVLGADVTAPFAVRLFAYGLPLHIVAGLGGWLSLTAMGVSYRLLAMFMLASESARRSTRAVLLFGAGALGVTVLGGTVVIGFDHGIAAVLAVAALPGLLAIALYVHDLVHLYRTRKRVIELNSRMAAAAMASLAIAAVLLIVLAGTESLTRNAGALVFLILFGWLSGLGLAMLYKIIPFLTWLECYGPVLGRAPTPRVQDLVAEQHARKWFALYFAAVWIGTGALLDHAAGLFRVAAALQLIATAGITVQLIRARRLIDVPAPVRFPDGSRRPALVFAALDARPTTGG
ncbi:MAG: hypothetical protein ACYCUX_11055 [Metallibacterium sp.]